MIYVYLHGYLGSDEGLSELAEAMPERPYKLWLLPGFGGKPVSSAAVIDFGDYIREVSDELVEYYKDQQICLIGHSYGAMVAYAVAANSPQCVTRLVVINPVAKPRAFSRYSANLLVRACDIVPEPVLVSLLSFPFVVDMSSYYMTRSHTDTASRKLYEQRRKECDYYSSDAFRLAAHSQAFTEAMDDTMVTVPTTISYATDDNIAGQDDLSWYKKHCRNIEGIVELTGGHQAVVTDPSHIAQLLSR